MPWLAEDQPAQPVTDSFFGSTLAGFLPRLLNRHGKPGRRT
jgi:hypothetical protein